MSVPDDQSTVVAEICIFRVAAVSALQDTSIANPVFFVGGAGGGGGLTIPRGRGFGSLAMTHLLGFFIGFVQKLYPFIFVCQYQNSRQRVSITRQFDRTNTLI